MPAHAGTADRIWATADVTAGPATDIPARRLMVRYGPKPPLHPDHIDLRYSCTNFTAIAPSPTAEATRLIDLARTSPAANTPARLVSKRNGSRLAVQCGECTSSAPVRTNS